MKTAIVLFAGALFTSAAFGAANDSQAEQRYKMKYGRNTPAVEALQNQTHSGNVFAGQMPGCCRSMTTGAAPVGQATEERFRMKYGRNTPAADRPAEHVLMASAAHTCEMACCQHGQ
jgi:hypothetical protein